MLSMLSALELLLFSLSFGGGLMLKEYNLLIYKVQYWKPVPHLAGEGEWLRDVEERAGESKRALWVISRVKKLFWGAIWWCAWMFSPSYLRIRGPINKFGKILFQAVEILRIRIGLKNWGYAALHLFLVPVGPLPITANRSTCRTRMWFLSNFSEAARILCIFLFDELTVWFSDTGRAWSQTLLLPETYTRCSHLIPS